MDVSALSSGLQELLRAFPNVDLDAAWNVVSPAPALSTKSKPKPTKAHATRITAILNKVRPPRSLAPCPFSDLISPLFLPNNRSRRP
jgi:hypothetical protein